MIKNWALGLGFVIIGLAYGQVQPKFPELSEASEVSILTCGRGHELYSAFGHSSVRVTDPELGIDIIYNYGTFDFDQPNFYWNFTKGKLLYSLSRNRLENFLYPYKLNQRWVKEQVLDISNEDKNWLFQYLENNYKLENRDYLYDPLFNNCSSIIGGILKKRFGDALVFPSLSETSDPKTYRELVREFMHTNSWSALGIELAFGAITDREAPYENYQFLPYYAQNQFETSLLKGKPLVKRNRTILNYQENLPFSFFIISPLFWLALAMLFVISLSILNLFFKSKSKLLDVILFGTTGILGIGLLLLWLATDHQVTQYNLNFIWLLPSNLWYAYSIYKSEKLNWNSKYAKIGLVGLFIGLLLWIFGIQVLSPLFLIPMVMLAVRFFLHAFVFPNYE